MAAVLWDMDGTLIDTEPLWLQAERAMLGRYGIEMTDDISNALVGSGLWAAAELFQSLGVTMAADDIVAEWVRAVGEGIASGEPVWRPGATELLASLREAGVPQALVTMSVRSLAEQVVSLLPAGTFDAIVAGDEVDHEKPHPDPYLRGAKALGVPIERCLAFEDSATGLSAASSAGAVAVGIPHLVPLDTAPAHTLVTSLSQLDAVSTEQLFRSHTQQMTEVEAPALHGPFQYGDRVQLTGPKGRLNTVTLTRGGQFHSHHGVIHHADIVGKPDASVVLNSSGDPYLALRPLLSDFVMSMPRGAAIVYPKDAAQIVSLADIFPGARVVEAGVGSGALSLHLLRAIGETGRLFSFERRTEFSEIARANVAAFAGQEPENWSVTVGDLQETLPDTCAAGSIDRVVLDMLAPWECVNVAAEALAPGGVLVCYVATVTQLSRTVEAIRATELFTPPSSNETLVRGWHVEGLAVRPDHRMVAHTGFLLTARRLAPGTVLPAPKRRASKASYSQEDLNKWLPGVAEGAQGRAEDSDWDAESLGQRTKSDRMLRKKAREARKLADDSHAEG